MWFEGTIRVRYEADDSNDAKNALRDMTKRWDECDVRVLEREVKQVEDEGEDDEETGSTVEIVDTACEGGEDGDDAEPDATTATKEIVNVDDEEEENPG